MKNFFKSMAVFVKALPHFLLFEFLYKLILAAAGAPLLALILRLTMKASGITYLSDESMMVYLEKSHNAAIHCHTAFLCGIFCVCRAFCACRLLHLLQQTRKNNGRRNAPHRFQKLPQSVQRTWHTSFYAFHALYAACAFHTVLRYVFSSASSYFKESFRQYQWQACCYMLRSDTVSFYFYHSRKKLQPALSCTYKKKIL